MRGIASGLDRRDNVVKESSMQITQEQFEQAKDGQPVRIAGNGLQFVLLRQDVFERVKTVLYDDGETSDDEAAQLAWEAGKLIGWATPEMAEYDDYDRYRNSP
jgi:hypothetical protein